LCPNKVSLSLPPLDGILKKYHVHEEDTLFKIPENLSYEEACFAEPLSVIVWSCVRAKIRMGHTVLITGAGPVGLLTVMTAKAYGATKVLITDVVQERLNTAKELGADHTLLITRNDTPQGVAKKVEELMGELPNVSMECSGAESAIQTCIYATENGGKVVLVGLAAGDVTIPILHAQLREVDLIGVLQTRDAFPNTVHLMASGKVNVKALISHRFPLKDSIKAFETVLRREGNKVVINCQE